MQLRRQFQALVFSNAWVRTPQLTFAFFLLLRTLFCHFFDICFFFAFADTVLSLLLVLLVSVFFFCLVVVFFGPCFFFFVFLALFFVCWFRFISLFAVLLPLSSDTCLFLLLFLFFSLRNKKQIETNINHSCYSCEI